MANGWAKLDTEFPRGDLSPRGKVEGDDGKTYASSALSAETLTECEETALRLRDEGRTLKEIAEAIGVSSPQTASNTLAGAESKHVELAEEENAKGKAPGAAYKNGVGRFSFASI